MLFLEHASQGQDPPDGDLDRSRDTNPDDLSSGNRAPSTSPTTSPETSDDEVEQLHKELYHLCVNKARHPTIGLKYSGSEFFDREGFVDL